MQYRHHHMLPVSHPPPHICTVRYCSTLSMSHLTILVWPGQRLARLPASARTQEIFLDFDGAFLRGRPEGPSRGTPVGQVALKGRRIDQNGSCGGSSPPDK